MGHSEWFYKLCDKGSVCQAATLLTIFEDLSRKAGTHTIRCISPIGSNKDFLLRYYENYNFRELYKDKDYE